MFTFPKHRFDATYIAGAFIAMLIGRVLNVYPLSGLLNIGRWRSVILPILWYSLTKKSKRKVKEDTLYIYIFFSIWWCSLDSAVPLHLRLPFEIHWRSLVSLSSPQLLSLSLLRSYSTEEWRYPSCPGSKFQQVKKTCHSWMINGDKLRVSIKDFFSSDSQRYPFSDQHFFDFDYLCCINSHILLLKEPYWESFNFIHFAETKVYWV